MAEPGLSRKPTPESPLNISSEHELQLERQAVRKLDFIILPLIALIDLLAILVCLPSTTRMVFISDYISGSSQYW